MFKNNVVLMVVFTASFSLAMDVVKHGELLLTTQELSIKSANENYKDLLDAVKGNDIATACMVLSKNVDINKHGESNGCTVFHTACFHGNIEMIRLLVEHKADLDARDDSGRPPLYYAVLNNKVSAMRELIRYGAPINSRCNLESTLLHWACFHDAQEDVISLLIESGIDVDAKDKQGITARVLDGRDYISKYKPSNVCKPEQKNNKFITLSSIAIMGMFIALFLKLYQNAD